MTPDLARLLAQQAHLSRRLKGKMSQLQRQLLVEMLREVDTAINQTRGTR